MPPVAPDVVEALAIHHGVCIRPVPLHVTDRLTAETEIISVPCQARLAVKCPPCAENNRRLRIWQCKAGWHLDTEPESDESQGECDDLADEQLVDAEQPVSDES